MTEVGSAKGIYRLENPNNNVESDRLDLQHQIWLLHYDGRLECPGVPATFQPKTVLDIGCGSGIWALSYAKEHPDREVFGLDLTPPSLEGVLPNLTICGAADIHDDGMWPSRTFDYIHGRALLYAVRDWDLVFQICWKHLSPGGRLEISDFSLPYGAENPATTVHNSIFIKVGNLMIQAQEKNGIDATAGLKHFEQLRRHDFVNIEHATGKWPMNGHWPRDEKSRKIGSMNSINIGDLMVRSVPALLATADVMSMTEAMKFCQDVTQEFQTETEMQYWLGVEYFVAQKPNHARDDFITH